MLTTTLRSKIADVGKDCYAEIGLGWKGLSHAVAYLPIWAEQKTKETIMYSPEMESLRLRFRTHTTQTCNVRLPKYLSSGRTCPIFASKA